MFEPIERHREDVLHAWSLARTLHRRVPHELAAAADAGFRRQMAEEAALEPTLRRSLERAAELAPAARDALLGLARAPAFLADPKLARLTLDLILAASDRPRLAERLAELLRAPAVLALDAGARRGVVRVAAAGVEQASFRQTLDRLLVDPGFGAAPPELRADLLDFLIGPELSTEIAPMRRNRMRLAWAARARALEGALRAPAHRSADPELAAERLRDFLHAPAVDVVFLDATARNGHAVMVFGDPSDPSALSYGQRWVLGRDRRPRARLHAPDPSCRSGWTRPMSDATVDYHGRAYRISRREERALVSAAESGHVFHDDLRARGLGPRRAGGAPSSFVERMEAFLTSLTAGRSRATRSETYRAGRPLSRRRRRARAPRAS